MGGGRSNKERQRLQPLASVARAPLFEVRRVRFYTQPFTGIATSVTYISSEFNRNYGTLFVIVCNPFFVQQIIKRITA